MKMYRTGLLLVMLLLTVSCETKQTDAPKEVAKDAMTAPAKAADAAPHANAADAGSATKEAKTEKGEGTAKVADAPMEKGE